MNRILCRALAIAAALTMLFSSAVAETAAPGMTFITPAPSPVPPVVPKAHEVTESAIEDDGTVRVLLRSLGRPDTLHLTVEGSYALEGDAGFRFDRGAQPVLTLQDGEIWLEAGGMLVNMGETLTLTRHAAEELSGLRIEESEKDNLYCGDLSVTAENDGLRCVLDIHMEDYLCGVVAYEMSDSFPVEALKAQAVAARTYALRKKFAAAKRDYDVSDTTADQVFKGYEPKYENVAAAVEATRGVVGVLDGSPAECFYTASNGGVIAKPSDVWGIDDDGCVEMREDPFDVENPMSLVQSLTVGRDLSGSDALLEMITAQLEDGWEPVRIDSIRTEDEALEGSGMFRTLVFELTVRREVETEPTPEPEEDEGRGWFSSLWNPEPTPEPEPEYTEETAEARLSVYDDIKDGLGLGLNSADYELVSIAETEEGFSIEMRRFGHGAGMSQRGAQHMAGEYGMDWTQILGFYYPGMTLERISFPESELTGLSEVRGYPRPEPTPVPTPKPLPPLEKGEWYAAVTLSDRSSMLNIREKPTTASRVLEQLPPDYRLIACGEPDADGWIAIRTADLQGYCKIEYLRETN